MTAMLWAPQGGASPAQAAGDAEPDAAHLLLETPTNPQYAAIESEQGGTVVVGLGNDIAGDDAVGILAARQVARRLAGVGGVTVIELPWAGMRLLEALRGYGRAILIDSLSTQGRYPPGAIVRLEETDLAGSVRLNSFHDLNFPTALALGRALGWPLPRRIEMFAVEGKLMDAFTTRLSPVVAEALDEVVRRVTEALGADVGPPAGEQGEDLSVVRA